MVYVRDFSSQSFGDEVTHQSQWFSGNTSHCTVRSYDQITP